MAVSPKAPKKRSRKPSGGAAGGDGGDPRASQRERTREAIMDAAQASMLEGRIPSIAEAAERARVSRATAYRYFPTQGALIRQSVDTALIKRPEWEAILDGVEGLEERIDLYVRTIVEVAWKNEALLRAALLFSLEQWSRLLAGEDLGEERMQRGGRLEGLRMTLEPFHDELGDEAIRRLEVALSVIVGVESLVIMADIWRLDEDEALQVTLWMARALVATAVAEAGPSRR